MATYQQDSYQQQGQPPPAFNPSYQQGEVVGVAPAYQQQGAQPAAAQGGAYYGNGNVSMKDPLTGNENTRFAEASGFKEGRCRDWVWIPIFLAQLFTVIGLSAYYYSKNSDTFTSGNFDTSFVDSSFWKLCACIIIIGVFSSVIWILFIRKFSYCLIWFTLLLCLSMWIIFGLLSIIMGNVYGLVIAIICALLQALWMWCVKDRIKFASVVLSMAITAANEFGSVYLVSFLSIFVQAFWMIVWIMGFAFVIYDGTNGSSSSSSSSNTTDDTSSSSSSNNISGGVVFLFLVSFYWTAQVIANTVHVTSAGVVATWYFKFPQNTPSYPVGSSFKRATTTSFGSICFGSFLIAVIQAMRAMIRGAQRSNNNFVRCCLQCILACIENILEYFNLYAFTRVAIYGQSYCDAAKGTWELFKRKGFDAIINDDLTTPVLNIGCLFAALFSGAICGAIAHFAFDNEYWYVWAIVAAIIAFGLTLCAMVVVRSGVATIFVCFAEDPAALSVTKPGQYDNITNAWRERYGKLPARLTNPQAPV